MRIKYNHVKIAYYEHRNTTIKYLREQTYEVLSFQNFCTRKF